jgi:hypothetical protein
MKPLVRPGLLIRELPDELLVYDREEHRAHCLNRTAATVFRHADGTRTLADLARLLDPGAGPAAAEIVTVALTRLAEAGLLESEAVAGEPEPGVTRRDLARRAGLAAAILLPAVASMVVPTPAEAAASCATTCAGQPNGTRCEVCFGGLNCATTTDTCSGGSCSDGCPNP